MKYILMVYSRTAYAEYPLPQIEAGQWELLLDQTRFDLPEELRLAIGYQNGCPQFLPGPFSIRSHSGRRGCPLPVEANEIYFLSPPSGGQLVMAAKGIEEEDETVLEGMSGPEAETVFEGEEVLKAALGDEDETVFEWERNPYRPNPIDTSDVALPDGLTELIEQLAENVHENWAKGRLGEGWVYGPVRDDARRTMPCLVPYAELSEEERNYDRRTALETIRQILKLGYTIRHEEVL